jgi:hypothetical protein
VLETACDRERLVDGGQIVAVLLKGGADGVDVAKRRKKLERARMQAFPPKQLQQPPGAGPEEALAHRGHYYRAGVDQQLSELGAGKVARL